MKNKYLNKPSIIQQNSYKFWLLIWIQVNIPQPIQPYFKIWTNFFDYPFLTKSTRNLGTYIFVDLFP